MSIFFLSACGAQVRASGVALLAELLVAHCERVAECELIEPEDVASCASAALDLACVGPARCVESFTLDAESWIYCVNAMRHQQCHEVAAGQAPGPCDDVLGELYGSQASPTPSESPSLWLGL